MNWPTPSEIKNELARAIAEDAHETGPDCKTPIPARIWTVIDRAFERAWSEANKEDAA